MAKAEKKVLRRKHARLAILMAAGAAICAFLPSVFYQILEKESLAWGICSILAFFVFITGLILVRVKFLRCPRCGRGVAMPHWKPGKDGRCPRCGKVFPFDDDLM